MRQFKMHITGMASSLRMRSNNQYCNRSHPKCWFLLAVAFIGHPPTTDHWAKASILTVIPAQAGIQ
jgi:hypothetical protein